MPKSVLKVCEPAANSGMFVLPTRRAPAALSRATTRSSAAGTGSACSGEPHVVRMPPGAWLSLCATGRPCSGATRSPAGRRAAGAAGGQPRVGGVGGSAGTVGVEGDDRVELRVDPVDPVEVGVHQLTRG